MQNSLLQGLRALDLTDQKGFMCGKILGSMGVDVIKIERPGGDPSRMIPPFINNTKNPERSLYWYAFNTDKRGITLNLENPVGQEIFKNMVLKADFVIESFTPGYLSRLKLGFRSLHQINPNIVLTSITPFGQTGPHSKWKGCELVLSAMSGVMDNCGDPDRPPMREGPDSIYFRGNAAAVFATILAYYHRQSGFSGQHIDVSLQDVDVSRTFNNLVAWEFDRRLIKRSGVLRRMGARGTRQIWSCKDGRLYWTLSGGAMGKIGNQAICNWIDEAGIVNNPLHTIADWEKLDMSKLEPAMVKEWETAIGQLFMKYTKKEMSQEASRRGLSLTIINNSADILEYPRFQQRDFWLDIEHPEVGRSFKYPRYFFLSNQGDNFVKRRAPLIGEHNLEIYGKEMGFTDEYISLLQRTKII
jgi:crotonobetainyl-CoA:carnitine CoA-transferase CaiB-like acyl-CoA transferase